MTKTNFAIDIFEPMRYTINDIVNRVILRSAEADERSVLHMKKLYSAPSLELLAFMSDVAIGATNTWEDGTAEDPSLNSKPWNDGELGGWT